ncbi:serine hydrolase [Clostridium sp.]|nr:serine hydrolase [Clostridium sp.]MBS5986846.1 D-alanyl-D-alanine carboxypeptidase [Clostridium sp.]
MTKRKTLKTLALALSISLLAPFASKVHATEKVNTPEIISKAGIVVDYDTGEVIYEKSGNEKMYLASTTKLMTALLFAENAKKTDQIVYTETALAQPPYTMQSEQMLPYGKSFKVGDTIDADTVMKELLLFSGNDAAYMIADHVGGTSEKFIQMMNDKAKELGLVNTHFKNPNGLPDSVTGKDVNYSTAYELSILTKKVYENEWIRETMALSNATVTLPGDNIIHLENRNTELGKNGNIGGKTGVTNDAGTCFAGLYERNGRKLIGVVLKSDRNDNDARFRDLNSMMDYSYSAEKQVVKKAGDDVGSLELEYKLFGFFGPTKTITANVTLSEDLKLYNNSLNVNNLEITLKPESNNAWKLASKNDIPLSATVLDSAFEVKGSSDLTVFKLIKANMFVYLAIILAIVIIVILIVLIIKIINNRKRYSRSRRRRRY